MSASTLRRWRWPLLAVVLPALIYALLLRLVDAAGGATVMLGAVSGTPLLAIAAMAAVLFLRLYLVLVVPALVAWSLAGSLASWLAGMMGAQSRTQERGP